MKRLKILWMCIVLCLFSAMWYACKEELPGRLSVMVTDRATGEPVATASADLLPAGLRIRTGTCGQCEFTGLEPGKYTLRITKDGYDDYVNDGIVVESNQTSQCDVQLELGSSLCILDDKGQEIDVLDLDFRWSRRFKIKNVGSETVEWEISEPTVRWIAGFTKKYGELTPGAVVDVEVTVDVGNLDCQRETAVVHIVSNVGKKSLTINSEVGLPMVYVAGGTFRMGCTAEQDGICCDDELPVHGVTLGDYYIGRYEVTQAQWKAVMGTHPSCFTGDDLPVESVSWDETVAFCEKLSAKTGKTYRLPAEAEWEYAARGGQKADGTKYAGSNTLTEVAWYRGNSGFMTHAVGTKAPNGLGLYDMNGNVWEWCSDWYGSYSSSSAINPQGPSCGSRRVGRGNCWDTFEIDCRVPRRISGTGAGDNILGFRVVCEP